MDANTENYKNAISFINKCDSVETLKNMLKQTLENSKNCKELTEDILRDFAEVEVLTNVQDDDEYELVDGRTFARQCSVTGEPMNQGWVVNNGEMYIKYEDDAKKWATDNHYDNLEQAHQDAAIYWTKWQDDDHDYKVVNGKLVEI